ncbi:MAG: UrcA family protein [Sphingomicrobium sp.]|jgi:UrcA family protein
MLKTIPALAALAISAALVVPTISYADDLPTARISYADLDLASDSGQKTLLRRMSFASDSLCGVGKWKALGLADGAASCSRDTMAGAQPAYAEAVAKARHGTVEVLDTSALIITAPR